MHGRFTDRTRNTPYKPPFKLLIINCDLDLEARGEFISMTHPLIMVSTYVKLFKNLFLNNRVMDRAHVRTYVRTHAHGQGQHYMPVAIIMAGHN